VRSMDSISDDEFSELLDSWASRWEKAFEACLGAEAAYVSHAAGKSKSIQESFELAAARRDMEARHNSLIADAIQEFHHAQAVAHVAHTAESTRRNAVEAAIHSSDRVVQGVFDGAEQKRLERERRRKEAKQAREAAFQAKYTAEGSASQNKSENQRRTSAPPRFTRVPGENGRSNSKSSGGSNFHFEGFKDLDFAWRTFEARLASGDTDIRFSDIPWPDSLPTVSGVTASDSMEECKKKLRAAVLRWHPDKWGLVLQRVVEADRSSVMTRLQGVTRRILDEKRRFL